MKSKLYVVEGTHDEAILKQLDPNIQTISVGGSQIKPDVLNFIVKHQNIFEIVLMFDPDHSGEKIRKTISLKLDNPTHIFVDRIQAKSKTGKKIGVEHLSVDNLKEALKHQIQAEKQNKLTLDSLYRLGLTGVKDSKTNREKLAKSLNLAYSNAKTLLERLNWLPYTEKDLKRIIDASS